MWGLWFLWGLQGWL
ncbi:hypothetical protein U0070_015929 [Myodes glareolus]|uniref:Uncharacterized protein n=1 Tax=Myodes glareolus TaxID=447135 RepID=A0AAW0GXB1_MYOGA